MKHESPRSVFLSLLPSCTLSLLSVWAPAFTYVRYWVGQRARLGFPIRWYRKAWMNFWANPIHGVWPPPVFPAGTFCARPGWPWPLHCPGTFICSLWRGTPGKHEAGRWKSFGTGTQPLGITLEPTRKTFLNRFRISWWWPAMKGVVCRCGNPHQEKHSSAFGVTTTRDF